LFITFDVSFNYNVPAADNKNNNGPLYTYIRFPQAGYPTDEVIYDWVYSFYDNRFYEFEYVLENEESAIGEINVHFDSYLVDNRYAGILQFGSFSYTLTMPPEEVVKTFNIDITRNEFLETADILDFSYSDSLFELLRNTILAMYPDADRHLDFVDESWFFNIVIGHEGIIVVLEKYQFLPQEFDTLKILLPYNDLGPALLIRDLPPLESMPPPPQDIPVDLIDPDDEDIDLTDDYADEQDDEYIEDDETINNGDGTDNGDDADTGDDLETGDDANTETDDDANTEAGDEDEPDADNNDDADIPDDEDDEDQYPPYDEEIYDPIPDVPPQSNEIDPSLPMVALSFDDGPGIFTDLFLDLFEQYNIRATFCVLGNLINSQSEVLARAVKLGNEVIGHSWDHKNMAKMNADDVRTQLIDTIDTIFVATNEESLPMFRPPYGAVSDTMRQVAEDLGYAIINWSVDSEDWQTNDPEIIFNTVMANVTDGSIILGHEIYESTLEAYTRLIPELISRGYQIVTVSELLYHQYGELEPGHVYDMNR